MLFCFLVGPGALPCQVLICRWTVAIILSEVCSGSINKLAHPYLGTFSFGLPQYGVNVTPVCWSPIRSKLSFGESRRGYSLGHFDWSSTSSKSILQLHRVDLQSSRSPRIVNMVSEPQSLQGGVAVITGAATRKHLQAFKTRTVLTALSHWLSNSLSIRKPRLSTDLPRRHITIRTRNLSRRDHKATPFSRSPHLLLRPLR
jgi:hypothetical protein